MQILSPFIRPGMTVLEPGPGMGFFTLPLARMVGEHGRVVAVEVQQKMLDGLQRRASKHNLASRIEYRLASANSLAIDDLANQVDFVLAFAMVHEMPKGNRFFEETARSMKPGASLLLAEPAGHVKPAAFESELDAARVARLNLKSRPTIRRSQTAVLQKE